MPTNHRLFVDAPLRIPTAANAPSLTLPDNASHYLTRVLRLRAGASVTLFNGDGYNYEATLTDASKRAAQVTLHGMSQGPADTPRLHLAVALLKGDKLDFALQKATELDVASIWLTRTARCELRLTEKRLENRMQHWRRIITSACEQSGRTLVPKLHAPQPLEEVLEATKELDCYCLDPRADSGELRVNRDTDVCLFTGPEGGYDAAEADRLAAACVCVQVGQLILRAETAPLVGLSLLGAARRNCAI